MAVHYEFGGFRLDPQRRSLADRNGAPVPLPPRAFDALLALVRQPGELIPKTALMKAIWPQVVVGDNSLDQLISRLRRALAEQGARQTYIDTERGRGYRFSADVRLVRGSDERAAPAAIEADGGNQAPAKSLYAQAVTLSTRPTVGNLAAACELLQTALTLQPAYAPALAYRALLRTVSLAFDAASEGSLVAAERDAQQALEIDPHLSQGHHVLANVAAARGAWNDAARHYDSACALEREPHARVSRIYQLRQAVGDLHGALAEAESIDPVSPSQPLGIVAAALSSLLLGRDSDALYRADRAAALGWPRTHAALQDIYFQLALRRRSFQEAADSMREALSPSMRAAGGAETVERFCAGLAAAAARAAAVASLHALIERMGPNSLGIIDRRRLLLWLTMLGALDDAFAFAEASFDHMARNDTVGLICARGMLWMQEMEPFRRDPRFRRVVARLRFAEYWKRHGVPEVALCSEATVALPAATAPV